MTTLLSFENAGVRRHRRKITTATDDFIIAEYAAIRIAPVYLDNDRTILASLSLLKSTGWRIEEIGGETVLVRPDGRRRREEERTE